MSGTIDPECASLCRAINGIAGLTTIESCCGHGKSEFHIWFKVIGKLGTLPHLLYWLDG